jgi:hypothetical protein
MDACRNVIHHKFWLQNSRKEVNVMLKKEAEYFGDVVILPFIDRYELVVLKTIAICEYGVRPSSLSSSFVRLLLQLYAIFIVRKSLLEVVSLYSLNGNGLTAYLNRGDRYLFEHKPS